VRTICNSYTTVAADCPAVVDVAPVSRMQLVRFEENSPQRWTDLDRLGLYEIIDGFDDCELDRAAGKQRRSDLRDDRFQ
jgi:hypothetical protein